MEKIVVGFDGSIRLFHNAGTGGFTASLLTTSPHYHLAIGDLTRRAVAMIIVSTIALVAVIVIAGTGASSSGPLAWSGHAQVFTHPTIPGDRILTGKIHNATNKGTGAARVLATYIVEKGKPVATPAPTR